MCLETVETERFVSFANTPAFSTQQNCSRKHHQTLMDLQKKRVADGALSGTEKRNLMLEWYLYQMHGDLLLPCFAWKYFWDGMTIFQEVDLDSFFRQCLLFFWY